MARRKLNGQTALITGGSKGIGRAIAFALAEEGMNLVLVARTEKDLAATSAELQEMGVRCLPFTGDAANEDDLATLVKLLHDEKIHINILVHNAGIGQYGPLHTFSIADYDSIMNTNMRSTFLYSKAFIPAMMQRGDGDVLFIASVSGLNGRSGRAIYCASKNAQVAFAQSLDAECRTKNVRISVMAPGGVRTDFAMGKGRTRDMPELGKMITAEDLAEAARYTLTQPTHMRVFLTGMRSLDENLHQ